MRGPVGLVHRRLSIIDIKGGHQPMTSGDGRFCIVYNGEIYNFRELRTELEADGYRFKTRSDTEVILAGFERWGEECLQRLNGIYAFALWDDHQKRLLLVRDPLGVKPLYYFEDADRLIFASELKAILTDPSVTRQVDPDSLALFLTLRYVPSPRCMLQEIQKLEPGHYLVADADGIRVQRYWTRIPEILKMNEDEAADRYAELLEAAVSRQLIADVPVGLYLSGGVDSALLLSLMSRQTSEPVRTYTVGFGEDSAEDESADARETAAHFGAEHHEVVVDSVDYATWLPTMTWHLEEPIGTTSTVPYYFVSQAAGNSVKVVLTGQGADEPWAGYTRYIGERIAGSLMWAPGWARRAVAGCADFVPGRGETFRRGLRALAYEDPADRFPAGYAVFTERQKRSLLRPEVWAAISTRPRELVSDFLDEVGHLDSLSQMLYLDTRTWLPDDLLLYGDKLAMAHSVEARVPFLDLDLLSFVESLPPNLKLNRLVGKYLHKRVARRFLPDAVVDRKKKGFASPMDRWLREGFGGYAADLLLDPGAGLREYFNVGEVERLLNDHVRNKRGHQRQIFTLMAFEVWHQTFCRL